MIHSDHELGQYADEIEPVMPHFVAARIPKHVFHFRVDQTRDPQKEGEGSKKRRNNKGDGMLS